MIGVLISALILLGVLKTYKGTRELGLEVPVALVAAPAILGFFLNIAVSAIGLPVWISYFGLLLFLVVPFLFLRVMLDQNYKVAVFGSIATLLVVFFVQVGMEVLLLARSGEL